MFHCIPLNMNTSCPILSCIWNNWKPTVKQLESSLISLKCCNSVTLVINHRSTLALRKHCTLTCWKFHLFPYTITFSKCLAYLRKVLHLYFAFIICSLFTKTYDIFQQYNILQFISQSHLSTVYSELLIDKVFNINFFLLWSELLRLRCTPTLFRIQ